MTSATTPFGRGDVSVLRAHAPSVVRRCVPEFEPVYAGRGWAMLPNIERVYVNERARADLEWRPKYDFARLIALLGASEDYRSSLARLVDSKGYHEQPFAEGPYPTEASESAARTCGPESR